MFQEHFMLGAEDPERDCGLIYKNPDRSAQPGTHVLIIGVGDYQAKDKFKKPLTSTTISARAVADWFLMDAPPCFQNQKIPLASLAILLSEPGIESPNTKSIYADGPVPRATFEATKTAVQTWVTRINTHKDNLAILYVASHGQSFLSRTGVQLEDFGLNSLEETSGMFELEQFVHALEYANPVSQLLLFDCCRTPTSAELPEQTQFGTTLISLRRAPGDHGETRQQCVICATALGELASGWVGGKTLFADALIRCLNGIARDISVSDWPVRPGHLIDKIGRFLGMYRRPEEMPQTPAGRAALFDINFTERSDEIPVFVSFDAPAAWLGSKVTITANGVVNRPMQADTPNPPFHELKFPMLTDLYVEGVSQNGILGSAKGTVYPPALFLQISQNVAPEAIITGTLPAGRSFTAAAEIHIRINSPVTLVAGAVAEIINRGSEQSPREIAVSLGGETQVDVSPGQYSIILRTPDGRVQSQDIKLADQQIGRVEFSMPESPHERLAAAMIAGAIREPFLDRNLEVKSSESSTPDVASFRFDAREIEGASSPTSTPFSVIAGIAGYINCNLEIEPLIEGNVRIPEIGNRMGDGRFLDMAIQNAVPWGITRESNARIVFAHIETPKLVELVALPIAGSIDWNSSLLVDRLAENGASRTTAIVESAKWSGLLGFLTARDAPSGITLFRESLKGAAFYALQGKETNALAATAGALVLVSASYNEDQTRWDRWLHNLANWFPGLPDGAIILGRRLMMRARTETDIAEAGKWFVEGFNRGVPLYSLSVDWLNRGLESMPGDDSELVARRKAARKLASRVDPTRAFTVIHKMD
jgi:hypothetical protein